MPLRELAAAWVRANFPFPTVQTEFLGMSQVLLKLTLAS